MKKKTKLLLIWFLTFSVACSPSFGQSILDNYIKIGLDSNIALKQQSFDLQKAKIDLERAKALFYPQVQAATQYTLASGGRTIDVPLGSLLNSVYSSLNQLTSSSKFPQVQNQSIQFLPNDYHDSKIEVSVPLYNPLLKYNKRIKEELISNQQQQLNLYKRELVFNIKQAYYQYLQAAKAAAIYTNALVTVNESLRYNEKLVKYAAATKEVVLKAKTEVSKVRTSLADAVSQQKNAAAYFNFLLNLPFETSVVADSSVFNSLQTELKITGNVPEEREELKQLSGSKKVLETSLRVSDTYKLPVLNGFYNIGFQGYGFKPGDRQFYQLGGVQLQWSIFKGNDNKLKTRQAQLDIDNLRNQYENVSKQLMLQVTTVYNQYQSAVTAFYNANDEVQSTREAYRLTQSRYLQGQALQIEWTDARTQMTNAEINYSLAQLAVLNKTAELERAMATYPVK